MNTMILKNKRRLLVLLVVVLIGSSSKAQEFKKIGARKEILPSVMLKVQNKKYSISEFILEEENLNYSYSFFDLNGDKNKELILKSYTGGANCCDAVDVFYKTSKNTYSLGPKTSTGSLNFEKSGKITYDFYAFFAEFDACHGCEYEHKGITPMSSVYVVYSNNRWKVIKGTERRRKEILKNMQLLHNAKSLKETKGVSKGFAMNLANFYFSFGCNNTATYHFLKEFYNCNVPVDTWWKGFKNIIFEIQKEDGITCQL